MDNHHGKCVCVRAAVRMRRYTWRFIVVLFAKSQVVQVSFKNKGEELVEGNCQLRYFVLAYVCRCTHLCTRMMQWMYTALLHTRAITSPHCWHVNSSWGHY